MAIWAVHHDYRRWSRWQGRQTFILYKGQFTLLLFWKLYFVRQNEEAAYRQQIRISLGL